MHSATFGLPPLSGAIIDVLENAPAGIAFLDRQLRFLYINPVLADMNGVSVADTVGREVSEVVPWLAANVLPPLNEVLRTGKAILNLEIIESTPPAAKRPRCWIESFYPVFAASGDVQGVGAIVIEITDRKRMEEALQESQGRAKAILDTIPDPAWLKDTQGRYLAANAAWCRFFLREEKDVVGTMATESLSHDIHRRLLAEDQKVMQSRKPMSFESTMVSPDGRTAIYEVSKGPLLDDRGEVIGTTSIARDVTARRQIEAQLRQAQKMEAVGRLAGGVAHDFRNQLTVIKGYADWLMRRGGIDPDAMECLKQILQAADRSAETSQQLLAFSRQQVLRPQVVNLDTVVDDFAKSLLRLLGEDIRFTFVPAGDLEPVRVDAVQFQQAMMNLVFNSRDAMPRGGTIMIQTANVELDEDFVRHYMGDAPGRYVMVSITDTGVGMDEQTLQHVFDPFFTTKPVGQGTGLGTAMVHGFVRQSGGCISVRSQLGQGTSFHIYLPCVAPAEEAPLADAGVPPLTAGKGTILVVDDEPAIGRLIVQMLRKCGYSVLWSGGCWPAYLCTSS